MLLSEVKLFLSERAAFSIVLPDGSAVPNHFHVTEVGETTKHFIDCGGKVRHEKRANFQLWSADDYDHRLAPGKLVKIIEIAEQQLGLGNLEVEVEYQGAATIEKYGLAADGDSLRLTGQATDCLAREACGIPGSVKKAAISLVGFNAASKACTPGGGCC